MTQFELGSDLPTQLAYARTQIETLEIHKSSLIAQVDRLTRERNAARDERDSEQGKRLKAEKRLAEAIKWIVAINSICDVALRE